MSGLPGPVAADGPGESSGPVPRPQPDPTTFAAAHGRGEAAPQTVGHRRDYHSRGRLVECGQRTPAPGTLRSGLRAPSQRIQRPPHRAVEGARLAVARKTEHL